MDFHFSRLVSEQKNCVAEPDVEYGSCTSSREMSSSSQRTSSGNTGDSTLHKTFVDQQPSSCFNSCCCKKRKTRRSPLENVVKRVDMACNCPGAGANGSCICDPTSCGCAGEHQNSSQRKYNAWTSEESALLIALVEEACLETNKEDVQAVTWRQIAARMPDRTAKQCRDRWMNQLRPSISHDAWSEEEDMAIVWQHSLIGTKWAAIASLLPGRTSISVKNRWHSHARTKDDNTPTLLWSYVTCLRRKMLRPEAFQSALDTCKAHELFDRVQAQLQARREELAAKAAQQPPKAARKSIAGRPAHVPASLPGPGAARAKRPDAVPAGMDWQPRAATSAPGSVPVSTSPFEVVQRPTSVELPEEPAPAAAASPNPRKRPLVCEPCMDTASSSGYPGGLPQAKVPRGGSMSSQLSGSDSMPVATSCYAPRGMPSGHFLAPARTESCVSRVSVPEVMAFPTLPMFQSQASITLPMAAELRGCIIAAMRAELLATGNIAAAAGMFGTPPQLPADAARAAPAVQQHISSDWFAQLPGCAPSGAGQLPSMPLVEPRATRMDSRTQDMDFRPAPPHSRRDSIDDVIEKAFFEFSNDGAPDTAPMIAPRTRFTDKQLEAAAEQLRATAQPHPQSQAQATAAFGMQMPPLDLPGLTPSNFGTFVATPSTVPQSSPSTSLHLGPQQPSRLPSGLPAPAATTLADLVGLEQSQPQPLAAFQQLCGQQRKVMGSSSAPHTMLPLAGNFGPSPSPLNQRAAMLRAMLLSQQTGPQASHLPHQMPAYMSMGALPGPPTGASHGPHDYSSLLPRGSMTSMSAPMCGPTSRQPAYSFMPDAMPGLVPGSMSDMAAYSPMSDMGMCGTMAPGNGPCGATSGQGMCYISQQQQQQAAAGPHWSSDWFSR